MEHKRGQHKKLYGDNQKQLTGYWPDVNVKTQSQHLTWSIACKNNND